MMSAKQDTSNDMMSCCASCGKTEGDGVQLRTCDACKSVRYCGVTCQRNHRPMHKKTCKKRAAELRDEILFKQPESSHLGDCPICVLPLPVDMTYVYFECCSKVVCRGCVYANFKREKEERLEHSCPFCRATGDGDRNLMNMKRIQANDPSALCDMGTTHYKEGKYAEAFQYLSKAAELGNTIAHYNLSMMYLNGQSVKNDERKYVHHLEEAAIGGHPEARYNLAYYETSKGRIDRGVKHWTIAANQGNDKSMGALKESYKVGKVSKEDFASALRAYQVAVNATKSPQREAAKQY